MPLKKKKRVLQSLKERIKQRRTQMMVHSYLYYRMDAPVVDDATFDRWANELVRLQRKLSVIGFYDEAFEDWDGSTGHDLPRPAWVMDKARWLDHIRNQRVIARVSGSEKKVLKKKVVVRKRRVLKRKVR